MYRSNISNQDPHHLISMFVFTKREHIYGCEILNQVFEILNEYEIVTIFNFLIYRYHYNSFANCVIAIDAYVQK